MSRRTWTYIGAVLVTGMLLVAFSLPGLLHPSDWLALSVLLLAAIAAQLRAVEAPNHSSFYATPVFLFAGVLLLPPAQLVLLILIPHLCEWTRTWWKRGRHLGTWYLQPFNIAKHLIAGTAAHHAYLALSGAPLAAGQPPLLALAAAGLIYVCLNQILLGQALVLARQVSWRQSGSFDIDSLLPELVMACIGASVATVWHISPWLLVPILMPLALIYRALIIPKLKQDAQIDAKTGLVNARHANDLFALELERAIRFNRPLSVIMADLDLLRTINNTHGHLVGDTVLAGVARIIRSQVRDCDIAGRFGGEEFVLVLLETTREEAREVAERIRQMIEQAHFAASPGTAPIGVTMSLGVASYPADGATVGTLTHAADVAVYQAKAQGRNRVVCCADLPLELRTRTPVCVDPQETTPIITVSKPNPLPSANAEGRLSDADVGEGGAQGTVAGESTTGDVRPTIEETEPARRPDAAQPEQRRRSDRRSMPRRAWVLILLVLLAGLAGSVFAVQHLTTESLWQPVFGVLLAGATFAQLYKADGPNHELFHPAPIFLFAGVMLLPAPLFVLLVIVPHLLEWGKERWQRSPLLRDWYLQPFNMAMYISAGLLAQQVLRLLDPQASAPASASLLVVAAILTYILTNQLILGFALLLARGIRLRDSKVLSSGLLTESVLACMGFLVAQQWQSNPWLLLVALAPLALMYQALSIPKLQAENLRVLQQVNSELTQANQSIHQLNDELFLTLAKIFDARDPYVGGHAAQVATYAVAIAQEMGLPAGRLELIRQAGYLHDIGKMAIPEAILHKAGKLTDDEFEIIKTHALLGAGFLQTSHGLRHLAPFVRHHHERWDGRGYPDGVCGEAIPLEARILNVCDSVEAMASDRPYHAGMSVEAIIAEVRRCAGTQFDPDIADLFIRIAEREGSQFVVNSARVVEQKHADPALAPVFSSGLVFAKVYNQVPA